MPIKTILAVTESKTALENLETAISVARICDAHLSILNVSEVPQLPFYGYGGQGYIEVWAKECDQRRVDLASVTDKLQARLAVEGISFDIRPCLASTEREDDVVARHAIYCDLALMLRSGERELTSMERNAIDGALFDSGRALVYVPRTFKADAFGQRVAIAWNARREAARAASDAMPFLARAGEVDIFVVDPEVGNEDHGEDPGSDIALVLSRHGLKVTIHNIASAGRPVSEALLDTARELDIDLLVMGAYGHSRLRQNILGGTTREMLENSSIPLLLSH